MPQSRRPPATASTAATVMSTTRHRRRVVAAMVTIPTPAPTTRAAGTVSADQVVSQTGSSGSPTTADGEAREHPGGQGDELAAGEARQAAAVLMEL